MATYQAIAALSKALQGLLTEASYQAEFKKEFGTINFELYQSYDFRNSDKEGVVSLFLYRISINGSQRRMPSRLAADGKRYRSPIPLDLYYLVTPWAKDAEKQQRLLGWCIRTLDDVTILTSVLLNHYLDERKVFRAEEAVELICEPLSLPDMINIWENLKPNMPTSITYVARMVSIESTIELVEYKPVQTREMGFGEVTN